MLLLDLKCTRCVFREWKPPKPDLVYEHSFAMLVKFHRLFSRPKYDFRHILYSFSQFAMTVIYFPDFSDVGVDVDQGLQNYVFKVIAPQKNDCVGNPF